MFPRSPELMSPDDTALLVIDVQEKITPLMAGSDRAVWNIGRLIDGAKLLEVCTVATEQYPQGLGPTIASLQTRLPPPLQKRQFSCRECLELLATFKARGIYKLLVCGFETHVCVQQSVMDLLGEGYRVYLPVDAVSSRATLDHETALRRMDSCGAVLTTTEAALFEWCETSTAPQFKEISKLVKQAGP